METERLMCIWSRLVAANCHTKAGGEIDRCPKRKVEVRENTHKDNKGNKDNKTNHRPFSLAIKDPLDIAV